MESIHGFDFFRLKFDADGKLQEGQTLEELKQHANAAGATDAVLIAHGFRNDENDATGLYTEFLGTFRQNLSRPEFQPLAARQFVVAGIYWPSKTFRETANVDEGSVQGLGDDEGAALAEKQAVKAQLAELGNDATPEQKQRIEEASQLLDTVEGDKDAQDRFVEHVLSLLTGAEPDPTEGLEEIRSKEGSELLDALRTPIILPTAAGSGDDGGTTAVDSTFVPGEGGTQGIGSFFGSIFGRIGQFLNLTSWYQMKNRSGVVGDTGVAGAVRDLKASRPGLKIHLVGHSLGGRLMAACAKSLATAPKLQPDSLTLLEAAFSHYGFSPDNGQGKAGFFRAVMDEKVVKGPLVATFSAQDTVVGTVYAIASRLAGDNVKAIGDANDPFGGIGRNGAQKTKEAVSEALHAVGKPYNKFQPEKVSCLDGSGGLIKNHGDVRNSTVTYAFASAVAQT